MTVTSESARNDYTGDGTLDTYDYGFRVFAATDLLVLQTANDVETELVLTTDYTVTGVGDRDGGTIVLTAGDLADQVALTIKRRMPLTQETNLRDLGKLSLEDLEDELDRGKMVDQQQQEQIDRSLKLPESELGSGSTLPSATDRASKWLAFDALGVPVVLAGSAPAIATLAFPVRDFGAIGDGVTDDTAAINAAFAAMRASYSSALVSQGVIRSVVFDPGTYLITGSINATSLKAFNTLIEGHGAVILAKCAGKPALDMLGCRWWHIKNLSIWGDQVLTPTYGIQIGRVLAVSSSAGDGTMDNVNIHGYYSKACLYNYACETCQYRHLRLYNNDAGSTSYCLIQDGQNEQNITSAFVAQQNAQGTAFSFNENLFIGADFRKANGGKAVLLIGSTLSRHHWLGSYVDVLNDAAFYLYKATSIAKLHLDVHVEVSTATHVLLIDNVNPASNVSVHGLVIRDQASQVSVALIDGTGTTRGILLDDCHIDPGALTHVIPVFGPTVGASRMFAAGVIHWPSSNALDISGAYFTGDIITKSTVTITHTLGSYRTIRRPDSAAGRVMEMKGTFRFMGNSEASAPGNYFQLVGADSGGVVVKLSAGGTDADITASVAAKGNAPVSLESNNGIAFDAINATSTCVNRIRATGSAAGVAPALAANGSDTDIDFKIQPKGAGYVQMGTRTASADALVTGYIEIKDAGGTVRRLAVIG